VEPATRSDPRPADRHGRCRRVYAIRSPHAEGPEAKPATTTADLIVSLGSACKTSWNLRRHFAFERAYPFDWWFIPPRAVLNMLEYGRDFRIIREDLHVSSRAKHNTVFNRRWNLLHHHDFPRRWENLPGVVFEQDITDEIIANLNSKYAMLFDRFFADVEASTSPVFVIADLFKGWPNGFEGVPTRPELNALIDFDEFSTAVRDRFGSKARTLGIDIGERRVEERDWGWFVSMPDRGERELEPNHFAEPVHAFRDALQAIGLSLADSSRQRTGAAHPPAAGAS
jgi:hypothetical protein